MAVASKYVLIPSTRNEAVWSFYKKAEASFWTTEEIDLVQDLRDWKNVLKDDEKYVIKKILAFFAASDGIVNENLALNFYEELQIPEVRFFYGFQICIENIHSETYSLLIDTLAESPEEKEKLFMAIEIDDSIKRKAEWCLNYTNRESASFEERLISFACCEGIFFSASFCAIFWLKKRGLMPGLCFSNELISRDEALHCDFACLLYKTMCNRLDEEKVHKIVREAVNVEEDFVRNAIPVQLLGLNSNLMVQYVKFCADRLLVALGHSKIYHVTCPFVWMTLISLQGKTNFFEKRVSEYAKANVGAKSSEIKKFSIDEDF